MFYQFLNISLKVIKKIDINRNFECPLLILKWIDPFTLFLIRTNANDDWRNGGPTTGSLFQFSFQVRPDCYREVFNIMAWRHTCTRKSNVFLNSSFLDDRNFRWQAFQKITFRKKVYYLYFQEILKIVSIGFSSYNFI